MQETLRDFILAHRAHIIAGADRRMRGRADRENVHAELVHGVPMFLTQLVGILAIAESEPADHRVAKAADQGMLNESAALHGLELLANGFTLTQVIHGYGDVCQVVTELASKLDAEISAIDFHVFNRCLDDAIAGAVTAYASYRESDLAYKGTERLGTLAHELRNLLNTAVLSFDILKRGTVGLRGSTGAMHSRSLAGLSNLIDGALAEITQPSRPSLAAANENELPSESET